MPIPFSEFVLKGGVALCKGHNKNVTGLGFCEVVSLDQSTGGL